MEALVLIGRILFSLIFIGAGIGHLADVEGSGQVCRVEGGTLRRQWWSGVSGVLIAAGGLGVLFGVWMDLAALGLAVYCLLTALLVHHFWTDEPSHRPIEVAMFMKNVSIAGAGLMIFALSAGGADDGLATRVTPLQPVGTVLRPVCSQEVGASSPSPADVVGRGPGVCDRLCNRPRPG